MGIREGVGHIMKPIKSEAERQERIAQIRRQLGSPMTSWKKRRDLNKYLNKLMHTRVAE